MKKTNLLFSGLLTVVFLLCFLTSSHAQRNVQKVKPIESAASMQELGVVQSTVKAVSVNASEQTTRNAKKMARKVKRRSKEVIQTTNRSNKKN